MYLYVELWKARPAWLALSREQRGAWMDRLLAGLDDGRGPSYQRHARRR